MNNKQTLSFSKDINFSYQTFGSLRIFVEEFAKENLLEDIEEINIIARYSHGYYDDIDCNFEISGQRKETDEEYILRLEKEAAKKKIDAENAKKSNAAEKIKKEQKDKEDFARLMKKFKGEEIDPNSI